MTPAQPRAHQGVLTMPSSVRRRLARDRTAVESNAGKGTTSVVPSSAKKIRALASEATPLPQARALPITHPHSISPVNIPRQSRGL